MEAASNATLALLLPQIVRREQAKWEKINSVKPFEYPKGDLLIVSSDIARCPIVFNYIDCVDHLTLIEGLLSVNERVVIHELFPFNSWALKKGGVVKDVVINRSVFPSDLLIGAVSQYLADHNLKPYNFVALHARLSDYKTFSDGRFYFTKCFYMQLAEALAARTGLKVLLFSDEQFDEEPSEWLLSVNDPQADFCFTLLQSAKIIVGPPSTFSGFAARIGREVSVSDFPRYIQLVKPDIDSALSRL